MFIFLYLIKIQIIIIRIIAIINNNIFELSPAYGSLPLAIESFSWLLSFFVDVSLLLFRSSCVSLLLVFGSLLLFISSFLLSFIVLSSFLSSLLLLSLGLLLFVFSSSLSGCLSLFWLFFIFISIVWFSKDIISSFCFSSTVFSFFMFIFVFWFCWLLLLFNFIFNISSLPLLPLFVIINWPFSWLYCKFSHEFDVVKFELSIVSNVSLSYWISPLYVYIEFSWLGIFMPISISCPFSILFLSVFISICWFVAYDIRLILIIANILIIKVIFFIYPPIFIFCDFAFLL